MLDATVLDRMLVARLIEAPPADYPQPPIHYLMGCYERSSEELRRAGVSEAAKVCRVWPSASVGVVWEHVDVKPFASWSCCGLRRPVLRCS